LKKLPNLLLSYGIAFHTYKLLFCLSAEISLNNFFSYPFIVSQIYCLLKNMIDFREVKVFQIWRDHVFRKAVFICE